MSENLVFDLEKTIKKAFDLLYMHLDGEKQTHLDMEKAADWVLAFMKIEKSDPYYDMIAKRIIDIYEIEVGIQYYDPFVITEEKTRSTWLYDLKPKTSHAYFDRYKLHLAKEGFSAKAIGNIEASCEKILSVCANPQNIQNPERKKGLVVGDVQSGKTANYLGLVNMAYDYGYKIVVLLAGLTDSLRLQTQKRTDEGVVGAVSDTIGNSIVHCGVGVANKEHYAIPFTNRENDFTDFINRNLNATINDFKKPVILVVKKNRKILDSVLDKLQSAVQGYGSNSILIIDDEADNASISTAKPGNNPTAINKCIRGIFNKFPTATYVGFTATPFANIFINPEDEDPDNLDLFPSDFIVQLNAPDNYFGGGKIFPEAGKIARPIRLLDEDELNFLPVKHKIYDHFYSLPESLIEAINVFLINNVIRTLRGHGMKHRSMMINISRFNKMQYDIQNTVAAHIERLKNIIEQDSYKKTEDFIKNDYMRKLYDTFHSDFYAPIRNGDLENDLSPVIWDDIQAGLYAEIKQIQTIVVNSRVTSHDRFNYDDYSETGARVIAIGGFVLSRGLTLEGLMVSYYSRNAGAYDILLQMCRWFGYRPKYEDLCRIYMSELNVERFDAAVGAVADLKIQFAEMERAGKTPKQFGLMVKESPDTLETTLLVTSRNKMYHSEEIIYHLNYGGVYADTSKFALDSTINNHNIVAFNRFFDKIKVLPGAFESVEGERYMAQQVSKLDVAEFIKNLKISYHNKKFETKGLSEYIESSDIFPYWDVVIATGSADATKEFKDSVSLPVNFKVPTRKFVVEDGLLKVGGANNRILDPGIFDAGLSLTQEEKDAILERKAQDDPGKKHTTLTANDYLRVREFPILVVYPLMLTDQNGKPDELITSTFGCDKPIMGFAIGFPAKESKVMVNYRINKIKLEELSRLTDDEDEGAYEDD